MNNATKQAKLDKVQAALDLMGDEIYKLYAEIMGISHTQIIEELLGIIDTDELIESIEDKFFQ